MTGILRKTISAAVLSVALCAAARAGTVKATFLGTTTILLEDGSNAILFDGFFSRPNLAMVMLRPLRPNMAAIDAALAKAGVKRLDAVIVEHSHYDHAMDAAVVAQRTGARVFGSESTAHIVEGYDLPTGCMDEVAFGAKERFGAFEVTFLKASHSPGGFFGGHIKKRLKHPARAFAYREGLDYAYVVGHGGTRIVIVPSAGKVDLTGVEADVIFLGVGGLGRQSASQVRDYWRATAQIVKARTVIPVHWDNFFLPLKAPLRHLSLTGSDLGAIRPLAKADGRGLLVLDAFDSIEIGPQGTVGHSRENNGSEPLAAPHEALPVREAWPGREGACFTPPSDRSSAPRPRSAATR